LQSGGILPLFMHVLYLFVKVLAGNKVAVITRWALCPLAADRQSVCMYAVSRVVYKHSSSPCSRCMYRPDSGMEKCLPSTQNQWLLFSPLQRPPVICNEYKAHIVARKTLTRIHLIFTSSLFFTAVAGVAHKPRGYWAKLQVSYS